MKKIDAIGLACPIPVVMAKKAINEIQGEGRILISVDNKASSENLAKLADSLGCDVEINRKSDQYDVMITKKGNSEYPKTADMEQVREAENSNNGVTVLITDDKMGGGDDELGKSLMKAFIYTLSQYEETPEKVIFYNAGAKLTAAGSAVVDDIKRLKEQGAEVLTCGACLNFYGLTEKLAVGEITNMYTILDSMNNAEKIIRP